MYESFSILLIIIEGRQRFKGQRIQHSAKEGIHPSSEDFIGHCHRALFLKIYNSFLYIIVLQNQPSYRAASILLYGHRKINNFDIRTDLKTPTNLSAAPTSAMKPSAALSRDKIFLLFP